MKKRLLLSIILGVSSVAWPQISVHAPMLTGGKGDTVVIPIIAGNVTGANILAFQFDLAVDGDLLTILDISTSTTLTDQANWTVMENILSDTIKIGAFGEQPLAGSGTLVNVRCVITGDMGQTSWLRINGFVFNAGIPAATVTHGSISILTVRGDDDAYAPRTFSLLQNYPNPFNPSTTIQFIIPRKSHVTLTVYDILGHQVAQLANGEREAGYHTVLLDGSGMSSGVYYYQLCAEDFIGTRRFLLLK